MNTRYNLLIVAMATLTLQVSGRVLTQQVRSFAHEMRKSIDV